MVGGESSRASARNSRQLAVVVALVTRPICPGTTCRCFLVQLAMSKRCAVIAAWSHCRAQRRAMRVGWLCIILAVSMCIILECASEGQHRSKGEAANRNRKVQEAFHTRARSARTIEEDMCL